MVLPAYAGMIRGLPHHRRSSRRAPRVCGDDPRTVPVYSLAVVVLPAYAGMIPQPSETDAGSAGAPRVCGDDPCPYDAKIDQLECSPRMRG